MYKRQAPGSDAERASRNGTAAPSPAASAGATTAAAQHSATTAATSHTPGEGEVSSRTPSEESADRSAKSRVSGPDRSGAATAAGRASSSASAAARPAIRRREAPRARSRAVSPERSVLSSRATSSSAYAASSTSCTATIRRVERETSSARPVWSRTAGSPVEAETVAPNAARFSARAFGPSVAAARSASIRSVVKPVKSAVPSQEVSPGARAPEARTAGSVSSGPYVVNDTVRTPRPPAGSSRQYGSVVSTGR